MSIRAIYYSVEQRNPAMRAAVLKRLLRQMPDLIRVGVDRVADPVLRFPKDGRADKRWYWVAAENLYVRILVGLQEVHPNDVVYLCEDDCIYADEHFLMHNRLPFDHYNYDLNMIHLTMQGYCVVSNRGSLALSHSFARADVMRDAIIRKLDELRNGSFCCFEPAVQLGYATASARCVVSSIDIRESAEHTWAIGEDVPRFQEEVGWPDASEMIKRFKLRG